jgi:heme-degrading monooxygenase HmoA
MYALIVEVNIDVTRQGEATQLLEEVVVPSVKAAPGFMSATWVRSEDGSRGLSLTIFESKQAAEAATEGRTPPEGAAVTLARMEVMEIVASA